MSTAKKLVLVDGTALIYRAYFAIPSRFTNSEGLHTNAIFGFTTMFKKLFTGRKPSHGAVVFDAPGKTFRDEKYKEYKANRERMPDDMREQLEHIDRVVHAHNFPLLRIKGYEADDVIGTLSRLGQEAGLEVVIVSSDKDFAQLVNDQCKMQDTMRDVTYDAELVKKKWGVPPDQIVDMLALVGDKADNIPGVPGIGQKGAAQLLEEYGSLDAILDNKDKFKGKRKQNLEEYEDDALLSQDLATIDQHAPVDVAVKDLELEHPSQETLNDLYKEFNFFSLLKASAKSEAAQSVAVSVLYEEKDIAAFVKKCLGKRVALDLVFDEENPAYGAWTGVGIALNKEFAYVPINAPSDAVGKRGIAALAELLQDEGTEKIVHSLKFWTSALAPHDLELKGEVFATQLASFLIDPSGLVPHGLPKLAKHYLQEVLPAEKDVLGSGKKAKRFSQVDAQSVADFSGRRTDMMLRCADEVMQRLEKEEQHAMLDELDRPLSKVLSKMERRGIHVDKKRLGKLQKEFQERLDTLSSNIHGHAGRDFNISSPKQLATVLFEELKLPVIKKTKTGYSTNASVLERLEDKHPIAGELLEFRKLQKLINTYTDVLQNAIREETGRVHATFQQTAGVTGRLITTDPDLQRTPVRTPEGAKIRYAFTAEKGRVIVAADWSQIELRVLAHISKDPVLVECYQKGIDVHSLTASEVLGIEPEAVTKEQREMGKTINFATIYGQGATALGQMLKVKRNDAKAYIQKYFDTYEGVKSWVLETQAQAHADGFVETLFGRRRYIPELSSNGSMDRAFGERIAANTPIQGTAADLCKIAMLRIDADLVEAGLDAQMVLQIHDEILVDCKEEEGEEVKRIVTEAMEHAFELDVPLIASAGIGKSWGDAKV